MACYEAAGAHDHEWSQHRLEQIIISCPTPTDTLNPRLIALASLAYALTAAFTTSAYMVFGLTLGKAYAFSAIVVVSCNRIVFVGGRFVPRDDTVILTSGVARSEAPREYFRVRA